jgi:hypothetical protein
MNGGWLLLLLLGQSAGSESSEAQLVERALQGEASLVRAYGEIIATARSCDFPEVEIAALEKNMRDSEIARAGSGSANHSFDEIGYAESFGAGFSAMRAKLAAAEPNTTPAIRAQACQQAHIAFDTVREMYLTDYDESPAAASGAPDPSQETLGFDAQRGLFQQAMVDGTQIAQARYCDFPLQTGIALTEAFVARAERGLLKAGVALDHKQYLEDMQTGVQRTTELMRLVESQYEMQSPSRQADLARKTRYDDDCREIRQQVDDVLAAEAATHETATR